MPLKDNKTRLALWSSLVIIVGGFVKYIFYISCMSKTLPLLKDYICTSLWTINRYKSLNESAKCVEQTTLLIGSYIGPSFVLTLYFLEYRTNIKMCINKFYYFYYIKNFLVFFTDFFPLQIACKIYHVFR